MAQQIDLTPATFSSGLHFHAPTGSTAAAFNNSSDFPSVPAKAAQPIPTVTTKITGTQGTVVRFSNPA